MRVPLWASREVSKASVSRGFDSLHPCDTSPLLIRIGIRPRYERVRTCGICGQEKSLDDFAFKSIASGRRQGHCRTCQKAYRRQHYVDNKRKYVAKARRNTRNMVDDNRRHILAHLRCHPCVDCGTTDIEVLEFDHREPSEKAFAIGPAMWRKNWTLLSAEIQKCDVRCANCHRRRTNRQFGLWRIGTLV